MHKLDHRLQVLIDGRRHELLRRRAEQTGTSVGAVVREAIDRAVPSLDPGQARAIDQLLELPPMPVDDWPVIEQEILESYERLPGEQGQPSDRR